ALGGLLAERARDVRDVRDRIVATLLGLPVPGVPDPGHPFVLVADDLAPADTAQLDPERVLAVVTRGGGPTSHTAILARALGIPAVVAVEGALALRDGETVLVDGGLGTVERDPSEHD
ncbi:PEP-utilizing enzyme, partial [Cellulosimicrobium funkei]